MSAAAPSRHRGDSFPGMMEVGGFFVEFEAVRTALTEMLRGGLPGPPGGFVSLHAVEQVS